MTHESPELCTEEVITKMDKKWSCPACEYKSGRRFNVERHIDIKHGDYGLPVLTEFRSTVPHYQASDYYSDRNFPPPTREGLVKSTKEKKEEDFISSYIFQDKKLGIYKKFLEATKLSPSEERNMIVEDLMLQMKRASSNPSQFWLDPLKIMTSAMITYPSPSDSVPMWWQEISKLRECKNHYNSESSLKSKPAVRTSMSADSFERKLQVALQSFLDYGKKRKQCDIWYANLEITPKPEKLTKAIQTDAKDIDCSQRRNIDLLYGKKVDSNSQIGISSVSKNLRQAEG